MEKIKAKYIAYHPTPDLDLLDKSYELAAFVYQGELRKNGQAWLEYILQLVDIVIDLRLDTATVCAALLSDVYKFGLSPQELESETNVEIRQLLDRLTHLRNLSERYESNKLDASYANYLRNVILTASADIRVVALRLVQKLVSLDSLTIFSEEEILKKSNTVLAVYAPLARFIGLNLLADELDEKAFKISQPENWAYCENLFLTRFAYSISHLDSFIKELSTLASTETNSANLKVYGRTKRHYSLFNKLKRYEKKYNTTLEGAASHIRDSVAFRVLVNDVEECYALLGLIHKKYPFEEHNFDDYIKNPKKNGYRSLQTIIDMGNNAFCEVQIRTHEMHEYNEYGPVSHIYYKMFGDKDLIPINKLELFQNLLTWKASLFTENTKTDISKYEHEVLVFTPKGDILSLPKGSCAIDFAYNLHTDLGNKIIRCTVNGTLKPLDHILKSGDVIEVVTSNSRKGPNAAWLSFVKSSKARIEIKKSLRKTLIPKSD